MFVNRPADHVQSPFSVRSGTVIPNFPTNVADLDRLHLVRVNEILRELGVEVPAGTDIAEKRQIIKQRCGIVRI